MINFWGEMAMTGFMEAKETIPFSAEPGMICSSVVKAMTWYLERAVMIPSLATRVMIAFWVEMEMISSMVAKEPIVSKAARAMIVSKAIKAMIFSMETQVMIPF
jgi:hypothetical protein